MELSVPEPRGDRAEARPTARKKASLRKKATRKSVGTSPLSRSATAVSSADSVTSRENDNQSFSNTLGFASLPRGRALFNFAFCILHFAFRVSRQPLPALSVTAVPPVSSADSVTSRENDNQSFSNTLGFASLPKVRGFADSSI